MQNTFYLSSLIISSIIALALSIFFWNRRPAPGASAGAYFMGAIAVGFVGYIIEQLALISTGLWIAYDILYIGLVSAPVFWYIFVVRYTGHESWFTRRLYLLWIIPAITLILTWTNDIHNLLWYDLHLTISGNAIVVDKTYGLWFIIHSVYSYILAAAGITLLALRAFTPLRLYRIQLLILMFSLIIPLIWTVIYILRLPPTFAMDLTPQAFIISGVIMTLGIFRYKILDIVPIARDTLVEKLTDGVVVLDAHDRIVDLNQAVLRTTGRSAQELIGQHPAVLWEKPSEIEQYLAAHEEIRTEIDWGKGGQKCFELNIIPLRDKNQVMTGRLIILSDLTVRKKMERALESYARRVTMVQEEERQRVARELHDDTAQALAILSLELDSLLASKEVTSPVIKNKIQRLRNDTDRAMQDVRRYSHELRPGVLDYLGLEAAIEQLVEESNSRNEFKVRFEIKGDECVLSDDKELALFRITQEAINNTRKHAHATRVKILLECLDGHIRIVIADNGRGFELAQSGFSAKEGHLGLVGMQERAQLIGAHFKIDTAPGKGTKITVDLDSDCNSPELPGI